MSMVVPPKGVCPGFFGLFVKYENNFSSLKFLMLMSMVSLCSKVSIWWLRTNRKSSELYIYIYKVHNMINNNIKYVI